MRLFSRRKILSCHPGIICERLEERIVLDATVAHTPDHNNANQDPEHQHTDTNHSGSAWDSSGLQTACRIKMPHDPGRHSHHDLNVVLVSKALDAIQGISHLADKHSAVIVFDEVKDNLASIAAALENLTNSTHQKIGGIAVLSHGKEGTLNLGSDHLTLFNVSNFKPAFSQISSCLTENAQIQFFGCSVASNFFGRTMIDSIGRFTGADVFASTDQTGGPHGDWVLEYSSNSSVAVTHIVDTAKASNSGIELAAKYPVTQNSWAKALNHVLYFAYDDGVHGKELWRSDGTKAGTYLLADINPGRGGSNPTELTVFNGALYFAATDGNGSGHHGVELWKSNGTKAGTSMVADINPGKQGSDPGHFAEANGVLYFAATDGNTGKDHGRELWKTNGTRVGTSMVADINPGKASSNPDNLIEVNSTLYFTATDGNTGKDHGRELWKSNGTGAGTSMVADINPGKASSDPGNLVEVNGTLYFAATDGNTGKDHGRELWKSNGTSAGTVMVADINPGNQSSDPDHLTDVGGTLYFSASDGHSASGKGKGQGASGHGTELWKSDGTGAGTIMVADINPGTADSNPDNLTNVHGKLYFSANDGTHGRELWMSSGTAGTTVLVKDIDPGAGSSDPLFFNDYNGKLLFVADDGVRGYELWRSDGTAAGTFLMVDINRAGSSFPINFARVNPLFFMADAGHGYELWKSDGTPEGTVRVSNLDPGTTAPTPSPTPSPSPTPPSPGPTTTDQVQSRIAQYLEYGSALPDSRMATGLFTTSKGPGVADSYSSSQNPDSQSLSDSHGSSTAKSAADSLESATEAGFGLDGASGSDGSEHALQAASVSHFVPGTIKVIVLSNGDYSIATDGFSLVVASDMWLPPMVQWYLVTVSEGRYRYGSLPPKYEAMVWDFLSYLNGQKAKDEGPPSEVTLRLAWQWAEWRKQVLSGQGNREVLPWDYFQGLSKALTAFYGKNATGQVNYSSALTAMQHNVKNLSIIPVRLPEETLGVALPK